MLSPEIWCLKENENEILRTGRAMARAMCDWKVAETKTTKEQINMLGLKEKL